MKIQILKVLPSEKRKNARRILVLREASKQKKGKIPGGKKLILLIEPSRVPETAKLAMSSGNQIIWVEEGAGGTSSHLQKKRTELIRR